MGRDRTTIQSLDMDVRDDERTSTLVLEREFDELLELERESNETSMAFPPSMLFVIVCCSVVWFPSAPSVVVVCCRVVDVPSDVSS